ncbi:PE domain-containing protein [Nocardia farcinica]|uniref:PE domain-containing protein n=1 Tax=Nocardia farcinica TaxID=37329 RepID=UPI002457A5D8|nr:PE domain-containing protein [Nocardia farcinica]
MGRVQVTSQSLSALAGDVESFGERLRRIADAADAATSPGPSAWGDDEFGTRFAEGEDAKGFRPGATTMSTNARTIATTFDNLAGGLAAAAGELARLEQGNKLTF